MSKRTADDAGNGSSQPPIKKVHFEPHLIGPVSTLEEMDIKVLQFQNKKLAQVFIMHVLLYIIHYFTGLMNIKHVMISCLSTLNYMVFMDNDNNVVSLMF